MLAIAFFECIWACPRLAPVNYLCINNACMWGTGHRNREKPQLAYALNINTCMDKKEN